MKMTKVLFGAAIFGLVFGFASCKNEDDENDMIRGSGSKYTIAYTNETNDVSRGYSSTRAGHDGELVQFTFDKSSTDGGVLGVIWDFNEESSTKKRTFWVLGLAANRNSSSGLEYYISKFYNISEINSQNFGAGVSKNSLTELASTISAGTACELVKKDFTSTGVATKASSLSIWADIYPTLATGTHVPGTEDNRADYTGGFTVKLYSADPTGNDIATEIATIDISTNETGYTGADNLKDKKLAVYANVYGQKSLNGAWNLLEDYNEAEVIEE